MENVSVEEKIKQKEIEISHKILLLAKNQELGPLLLEGSCLGDQCGTSRNTDLAKAHLNHIIGYFANMDGLILERLQKKTLDELGQLLALYLEKKEIYYSEKK